MAGGSQGESYHQARLAGEEQGDLRRMADAARASPAGGMAGRGCRTAGSSSTARPCGRVPSGRRPRRGRTSGRVVASGSSSPGGGWRRPYDRSRWSAGGEHGPAQILRRAGDDHGPAARCRCRCRCRCRGGVGGVDRIASVGVGSVGPVSHAAFRSQWHGQMSTQQGMTHGRRFRARHRPARRRCVDIRPNGLLTKELQTTFLRTCGEAQEQTRPTVRVECGRTCRAGHLRLHRPLEHHVPVVVTHGRVPFVVRLCLAIDLPGSCGTVIEWDPRVSLGVRVPLASVRKASLM